MAGGHAPDSSGDLISLARSLLLRAGESWMALAGRIEVWEDEGWLEEGRARYHGSAASAAPVAPDIRRIGYDFAVAREPWRVRLALRRSGGIAGRGSDPDLIIVRDETWWARTGARVWTNAGDAAHSHGLYYLDLLTCPAPLADSLDFISAEQGAVGERRTVMVTVSSSEATVAAAPALIALSADRYELAVDVELGILLRSSTYMQGRLGREVGLHDLRVNPLLRDAEEFAPPGD